MALPSASTMIESKRLIAIGEADRRGSWHTGYRYKGRPTPSSGHGWITSSDERQYMRRKFSWRRLSSDGCEVRLWLRSII